MYTYQDLGRYLENGRRPGIYNGVWIDESGNIEDLKVIHVLREDRAVAYYKNMWRECGVYKAANDWSF